MKHNIESFRCKTHRVPLAELTSDTTDSMESGLEPLWAPFDRVPARRRSSTSALPIQLEFNRIMSVWGEGR
jgi:hypothetical protein